MAIIFHSLPLALLLGELVPSIHQLQPLQEVFRQRLVKVRVILLCNILSGVVSQHPENGSVLSQPLIISFFSVLPSVTWHLC